VWLGLAALTRETALPAVLLAAAWLAWPDGRRSRWKAGGALLLAALFVVGPWTVRNWKVFGAFVPISTYGALNLWVGNAEGDREDVFRQSDSVDGAIPQYRLARAKAKQAIRERQPWWIFEKTASEVPRLFAASSEAVVFLEHGAYGAAGLGARRTAWVLVAIPWASLVLIGLPALVLTGASRPRALLVAFFIYYVAVHIAAFGHHRFHIPLIPVLTLFTGGLLLERRHLTVGQLAAAAVLAVVAAAALAPSILGKL
jgi:hypothetical protein